MNTLFAAVCLQILGLKDFIAKEIYRMRKDERGMELIQILFIIIIVIALVVIVWAWLRPWIVSLMDTIEAPDIS